MRAKFMENLQRKEESDKSFPDFRKQALINSLILKMGTNFDQCLMAELQANPASPNTMHLYEQEKRDMSSCYPSVSQISPTVHMDSPCDFDLKPKFEYDSLTDELFNDSLSQYLFCENSRDNFEIDATSDLLRMEDIFQVDSQDANQGPTLAELNSPHQITDITSMIKREKSKELPVQSISQSIPMCSLTPCSVISGSIIPSTVNSMSCGGKEPSSTITSMESMDISMLKVSDATDSSVTSKQKWEQSIKSWAENKDAERTTQDTSILRRSLKRPLNDDQYQFKGVKVAKKDSPKGVTILKQSDSIERSDEEDEEVDEGFDSDLNEDEAINVADDTSDDEDSIISGKSQEHHDDEPLYPRPTNQYFWQYNLQSKGPKGKPLKMALQHTDPHDIGNFQDPVFSRLEKTAGIKVKHSGKARKGDGTDVRASPKKLYQIGNELKKLNKVINDMAPVSELPANVRPKTRKEKNKLASRACRLKKKAHHEANKVKLHGLDQEHQKLLFVLSQIKEEIQDHNLNPLPSSPRIPRESMIHKLDSLIKANLGHMIAGHTQEYVNSVIEKVRLGDPKGGLRI
ncbi:unnamed protein product [Owenia fusiformis]|uniref:Uncharacterized protein n=1 Tax=Owenia fusiformis TaxID=6347 RepID=A0A8J1T7S0_OWEFU|nr:unnamed protein product [Owenia fusiformis]